MMNLSDTSGYQTNLVRGGHEDGAMLYRGSEMSMAQTELMQ